MIMTYTVTRSCSLTGEPLVEQHTSSLNLSDFRAEQTALAIPDELVDISYNIDFMFTHAELILRARLALIDHVYAEYSAVPISSAIDALDSIAAATNSEVISVEDAILLTLVEFDSHSLSFANADNNDNQYSDQIHYTILDKRMSTVAAARVYSLDHARAIVAAVERLYD